MQKLKKYLFNIRNMPIIILLLVSLILFADSNHMTKLMKSSYISKSFYAKSVDKVCVDKKTHIECIALTKPTSGDVQVIEYKGEENYIIFKEE